MDVAQGITVDADGNVLIAGGFHDTVDFDPTDGVDEHTAIVFNSDYFVMKLHCVEPTADVNNDGFADLRDYAMM